jgi:hypothetical protein
MSRNTFVPASALALCIMFAGLALVTRAQPPQSAELQATRPIILAEERPRTEVGVPQGAKCVN